MSSWKQEKVYAYWAIAKSGLKMEPNGAVIKKIYRKW